MTGKSAFEQSKAKQTSSSGRLFGRSVIYGKEDDARTAYMTRYWIGRLRLHIFYRGDHDPDAHDHPWNFWTFPLTPYVEEVAYPIGGAIGPDGKAIPGSTIFDTIRQVVPAWRLTFRPANHTHRVLGRYNPAHKEESFTKGLMNYAQGTDRLDLGPATDSRKIVTLVWRGKEGRKWGFLKRRDEKWCWVHWKEYVFGGGKDAPCQ